ncbi:MAG: TOBE domain-containing protein [Clostridium sp.]|uniref:TOBE domain-containing protein n=1 Tax=Clostridium sp. TaxID=1506 RepID=UPI0025C2FA5E|nr:TOBE domain-containing protein [Clostridium sp.]MCE5221358.1 TOBE domain-containing protein [Clostridium sp.]
MKLSARNQLVGKVVKLKEGAVNALVKIEIAKDIVISMDSVKELELTVELDATTVIKASSVIIMA